MIKVFEMFSGYGGASFALKKAGIEFECVGHSEIDKFAIQCFNLNHPGIKNYGDCKSIKPEELPDFDLLTGGFPCQSFSVAGKGLGELDPRGTLFYDIIRIAEAKKPKWMLLENVKGLTTKKHKATFDKILSELKRIGYDVAWKVLNSKEHGIPQNRERVFFVCKLGQWNIGEFQFPEKEQLSIFIKDILEKEVDAKYFLKPEQVKKLIEGIEKKMRSKSGKGYKLQEIKKIQFGKHQQDAFYEVDGIIGTIPGGTYGSAPHLTKIRLPKCVQWDTSGKGYKSQEDRAYNAEGEMCCLPNANPSNKVNIFALRSWSRTGTKEQDGERFQNAEFRDDGCSNSLTSVEKDNLFMVSLQPRDENRPSIKNGTSSGGSGVIWKDDGTSYCVDTGNCHVAVLRGIFRRLTPKECFRLMGFLNDEIILDGLSDTQKYRLAGNGWDINLVSKILKNMFKEKQL